MTYRIWTDGSGNTRTLIGAWAFVAHLPTGEIIERSAGAHPTTNNRMEMQGVIEALRFVAMPWRRVEIISDSQYVIQGATQWVRGWRHRGWRTAEGKPIANQDLWETLDPLVRSFGPRLRFTHVRGHTGVAGNERADKLCTAAVKAFKLEITP